MSAGVFAISRGVFDHVAFADEPFTEREAWIWMIGEAAWKARRVRVGSVIVSLERGQLAFSMRFAAAKWKWSEARVRRFLKRLKSDAMIDARSDAHSTQVTICKYDEYQRVSLPVDALYDAQHDADVTQDRRSGDAVSTQGRRKVEDREYREDISSLRSEGASVGADDHQLSPQKPKAPRATRLPADWAPSTADRAYAVEHGIPHDRIDRVAEDFRGYWLAKAGSGATKLDWSLTWQGWCRREAERLPRGSPQASARPPPRGTNAMLESLARLAGDDHDVTEFPSHFEAPFPTGH